MSNNPKIVKSWDSMPPVLNDVFEEYSIRVLKNRYREMERCLKFMANQKDLTGNWAVEMAKNTLKDIGIKYDS